MLDNPRAGAAKAVAALGRSQARAETGLFLLEGPVPIAEALRWRPEALRELWATPAGLERRPELADALQRAGLPVQLASDRVLAAMADTVHPQGWLAVARQQPTTLEQLIGSAPRLVAVLEAAGDPGNVGTVIRTADAAGADAVVLTSGSVELHNPKTVRSTMGSIFHLPVVTGVGVEAALAALAGAGLRVLAADMAGEPLPALAAAGALAAPTAWVFGTEAQGLSPAARAAADGLAAVPIYGRAESMNLAMAASVCLYASAFAQRGSRA